MDRVAFVTEFNDEMAEHRAVALATCRELAARTAELVACAEAAIRGGGKIMLFGNGGSAADAQHIAAELVGKLNKPRDPIAAIALTTDTSALTAIGNDDGFRHVFARQIRALGRPGDLAIAVSTSGNSSNVLLGAHAALDMAIRVAALSGGDGGDLAGLADPLLIVPSKNTARIQEMHITLGHIFCRGLERALGLAP